jgi:S1-C subfamily serine protease
LQFFVDPDNTASSTSNKQKATVSSGTCFVISPTGQIVTNYHVIEGYSNIEVTLANGISIPATASVVDKSNDIAILKANISNLNFMPLAKSSNSDLGDTVFTIGYPASNIMGKNEKYSEGVINAFSGPKDAPVFLQISVPLQPGNSGGPLVNERGEAIGIVSAVAADLYFYEQTGSLPLNVNWAIKSEYVQLLISNPETLEPTTSKKEAIERTQQAICRVIANNN